MPARSLNIEAESTRRTRWGVDSLDSVHHVPDARSLNRHDEP